MNRRDLLKLFGIGTTITPVVGGAPIVQAAAKLLAIPEISLVEAKDFPAGHSPEHFLDRTKWNPYEALWLAMWQIENNPPWCVNSGKGPLEHILKLEPTAEEKAAVAGVIQWFGTNCGHGFLTDVLRESGYRVEYWGNESTAANVRREQLQRLQHGNVWRESLGKEYPPDAVKIPYRGKMIVLSPARPFTVEE